MNAGRLLRCPACHQRWPSGEEFQLRSFGWLGELPRSITPSNADWIGWIHDGQYGRNRFLVLEAKGPKEPLLTGQARFLQGLAALPSVDVRVLRGTAADVAVYRVLPSGVQTMPIFRGWASTYSEHICSFVDGKQAA